MYVHPVSSHPASCQKSDGVTDCVPQLSLLPQQPGLASSTPFSTTTGNRSRMCCSSPLIFCSEHFCETTCAQVCKYGHQIKCKEASPSEDLAFECGKVSIYIAPSPSTIKRETTMTGRVHHFLSKRLITAVSSSHSPRFCSLSVHALSAAQNMSLTCTF